MTSTIGVSGATGQVGGRVARALAERGAHQRLLVRDPEKAPEVAGAELREIDYADFGACRSALVGVSTLFMVSGREHADRLAQHMVFVDAAADAGVEHVVYTSFVGAAADSTFTLARDHFRTEEHIRASGMDWTFLRDNFYLDVLPYFADAEGVIRGPAGRGQVAAVARADVARSAVAVLSDPAAHRGRIYDLTGPEALTMDDIARVCSEVLGRPFRFVNETLEEAYESRAAYGAEPWQVDAWVSTYTGIAAGDFATVTDGVVTLTGRRPLSLTDLLAGKVQQTGS